MYRIVHLKSDIQIGKFCIAIEAANSRRSPGYISKHVKELHIKLQPLRGINDSIKRNTVHILENCKSVEKLSIFGKPFQELDRFLHSDNLPMLTNFSGMMECMIAHAHREFEFPDTISTLLPDIEPSFLKNIRYLTLVAVGSDADIIIFAQLDLSGLQNLTHIRLKLCGSIWRTIITDSPWIQRILRTCSQTLELLVIQVEGDETIQTSRRIRGKRAHKVIVCKRDAKHKQIYVKWETAKRRSEELKKIRYEERGDEEDAEDSEGESD